MTASTPNPLLAASQFAQYQGAIVVSAERWGVSPALLATQIRSLFSPGNTPTLTSRTIDILAQNMASEPTPEPEAFTDDPIGAANAEAVPVQSTTTFSSAVHWPRLVLIVLALAILIAGVWFVIPARREG